MAWSSEEGGKGTFNDALENLWGEDLHPLKPHGGMSQEEAHRERNQDSRDDYVGHWRTVATCQILVTGLFVFLQGLECCSWKLEPSVMIALLGSASLNALSVVIVISQGLFKTSK